MPGVFDSLDAGGPQQPPEEPHAFTGVLPGDSKLKRPHFQYPLTFARKAIVIDEESDEEVIQTAGMVLRYRIGERLAIPDYGIREQALRMRGANLHEIRSATEQWDDRAETITDGELREIVQDVTVDIERSE